MDRPYAVRVEAFFVVVMVGVLLGTGLWAVRAVAALRPLADRRTGDE